MRLLEYQAKALLAAHGIPIPSGERVRDVEDLEAALARLGPGVAVKAQVPAGGRGKAGGIRLCSAPEEARDAAITLLGAEVAGHRVDSLLVEERLEVSAEYLLACTLARDGENLSLVVSGLGGMDVEDAARLDPASVQEVVFSPLYPLYPGEVRRALKAAGVRVEHVGLLAGIAPRLASAFHALDALYLECNPIVITSQGRVLAADARLEVDDNAVHRHPEMERWREESERDSVAARLRRLGIDYVPLEGEIGLLSVGAGETMTAMDVIVQAGGRPGCFMDFSRSVTADGIGAAVAALAGRPDVRAVLCNIFGGMTRVDRVAEHLLASLPQLTARRIPLVVRLEGTEAGRGRELLRTAGVATEETLLAAARRAVALVRSVMSGGGR